MVCLSVVKVFPSVLSCVVLVSRAAVNITGARTDTPGFCLRIDVPSMFAALEPFLSE